MALGIVESNSRNLGRATVAYVRGGGAVTPAGACVGLREALPMWTIQRLCRLQGCAPLDAVRVRVVTDSRHFDVTGLFWHSHEQQTASHTRIN